MVGKIKGHLCIAKDALLSLKRYPFIDQKMPFYNVKEVSLSQHSLYFLYITIVETLFGHIYDTVDNEKAGTVLLKTVPAFIILQSV